MSKRDESNMWHSAMTTKPIEQSHPCGCIGPQNGQPLCPCRMRGGVQIKDGRYIETIDHGPASDGALMKVLKEAYGG